MRPHRRWFALACGFEAALLGAAALLAQWFGHPIFEPVRFGEGDVLVGCLAALPMLALFLWALHSPLRPLVSVRAFLEARVRPFFADWSLWELLCISVLAGVSEEMLFRGLIQGALAAPLGQPAAILLASLAFGAAHWITPAYFVIATVIGAAMSGLWLGTGNLLTPMVTHAVYDFAALTYFLRFWRGR